MDFYRPAYLPDMSRWRPEDFLPPEYLQAPLRDVCELPEDEWLALLRLDPDDPEQLARLKAYAEDGFVQAMGKLADDYCSFPPQQDALMSVAEGLAWARRGAASGEPFAMSRLGNCMRRIYVREGFVGSPQGSGIPSDQLQLKSFWIDEMLYWEWRAVQALEPLALFELYRGVNHFYFPVDEVPKAAGTPSEVAIESYKWLRLAELARAFKGFGLTAPAAEVAKEKWPEMTAAEVAEAERRVGEFLRRYGGGLASARLEGAGCPHGVDFAALNKGLAAYGLKVEPVQPWEPPRYPLPALPGPLEPVE